MAKFKKRKRVTRIPRGRSRLETTFAFRWKVRGWLAPVEEYRFHPDRQWRFDFAWPDFKVALEVEGGTRGGGRHTRADGFRADCEKYNEAAILGWLLIRVDFQQVHDNSALDFARRALEARGAVLG